MVSLSPVCDHRVVPHHWGVIGGTPRGQPRDALLCTFRRPFMGRPVPRQLMRNELLDLTTIVPAILATAEVAPRDTVGLYHGSLPDDLVWASPIFSLLCDNAPFLRATTPTPGGGVRGHLGASSRPRAFPRVTLDRLLHRSRHQFPSGGTFDAGSVRLMLRPAWLLAFLDWSDLTSPSAAEDVYARACPRDDHSPPESGMTTQHPRMDTVAGLPPAGALPLQAARYRSQFPWFTSVGRYFPPGFLAVQTGQISDSAGAVSCACWLQRVSLLRWVVLTMALPYLRLRCP